MKQKEKFILNEGILACAWAYGASIYQGAAMYLGIVAVAAAILFHSFRCFARNFTAIAAATLAQLFVLRLLKIHSDMPSLGVLVFCTAACSAVWTESSRRIVRSALKVTMISASALLLAAWVIPSYAQNDKSTILIMLMFFPQTAAYMCRLVTMDRISNYFRRMEKRIMSLFQESDAHEKTAH